MSTKQVNKNRKIGALVAYTTLACSLVSLGVYVYQQQQKAGSNSTRTRRTDDNQGAGQNQQARSSLDPGRSTEARASSISRLGSKIARTVKRNRKVMTISLKNTIVWNPSPDPTAPNYGFVEGAIPLLFHLAENYNLHLILLCPAPPPVSNGKARILTLQEQDELKQQQQLGQEREREQILTMFRNAGLISTGAGPKLVDPRQLLICETEEGVSHVVRHLESQVHVEAQPSVVELVQGVVPKVVVVQKKAGRSSRSHSQASSTAAEGEEDVMTRSHVRARSGSKGGAGSGSASSEGDVNGTMEDSFVEVIKATHEPLVSGYVTQAGKKGYVEVTDQLMRSSLNPEYN